MYKKCGIAKVKIQTCCCYYIRYLERPIEKDSAQAEFGLTWYEYGNDFMHSKWSISFHSLLESVRFHFFSYRSFVNGFWIEDPFCSEIQPNKTTMCRRSHHFLSPTVCVFFGRHLHSYRLSLKSDSCKAYILTYWYGLLK